MDPEDMVTELQEHIDETDGMDYTSWEIDFVQSMTELVDDGREFTEVQIQKIEEIYEQYLP